MKKIIWDAEFSVGVKRMDVQHQRIIRMYNKLVEHSHAHVGSEALSQVLQEMVEYASEHFKSEEQLLKDHGYPDLQQQKKEHREFKLHAGNFCLSAQEHGGTVGPELLVYLHDWWTNHILLQDKGYAIYFKDRQSLKS
jgi:hemerythrin